MKVMGRETEKSSKCIFSCLCNWILAFGLRKSNPKCYLYFGPIVPILCCCSMLNCPMSCVLYKNNAGRKWERNSETAQAIYSNNEEQWWLLIY